MHRTTASDSKHRFPFELAQGEVILRGFFMHIFLLFSYLYKKRKGYVLRTLWN